MEIWEEPETDGVVQKRSAIIRDMIDKHASLEEMSTASGVQTDRVLMYMEDFLQQGIPLDLGYLVSSITDAPRIRESFEELGTSRLKPVFEALEEAIPYTTLRLVRCAMMAESNA